MRCQPNRQQTHAGNLEPGERLHDLGGAIVTVVGVVNSTGLQAMYDLTIDGVHTYYVEAGDDSVLVHNCWAGELGGKAADLDIDELAQAAFQHAGEGDLASTPTIDEIAAALRTEGVRLKDQNAVRFSLGKTVVIINEDAPFRSTAYIRGGD